MPWSESNMLLNKTVKHAVEWKQHVI